MVLNLQMISKAYGKVRSGADFPAYIKEIRQLGVAGYESFVTDGRMIFRVTDGAAIHSPAKHEPLTIAATPDLARFSAELRKHQQGFLDYPAFCSIAASTGVAGWRVDTLARTCTYEDATGASILVEQIPDPVISN